LVEQRFWLIMGEVWIECKRLILKLSKVLIVVEGEGSFMHPNQRLIPIQKWYDPRDIQLTEVGRGADIRHQRNQTRLSHSNLHFPTPPLESNVVQQST